MASSISTANRVALSPLNVNTPIARVHGDSEALSASSVTKPMQRGKSPVQAQTKAFDGSEKRMLGDAQEPPAPESPAPRKKAKTSHHVKEEEPVGEVASVSIQVSPEGAEDGPSKESLRNDMRDVRYSSPASSLRSSIASIDSSPTALNDSQQTVLTEPDDAPLPATTAPGQALDLASLSKEELRERANALKLRLRLASYKVRTNQINTPLSQLQIRTTSHRRDSLPRRAPLPSTSIPNIQLQQPSSERKPGNVPSSPPAQDPQSDDNLATPILPRQREGIIHPPTLGSPSLRYTGSHEDLTSSVMKGRAADGLLSLMRQHS